MSYIFGPSQEFKIEKCMKHQRVNILMLLAEAWTESIYHFVNNIDHIINFSTVSKNNNVFIMTEMCRNILFMLQGFNLCDAAVISDI